MRQRVLWVSVLLTAGVVATATLVLRAQPFVVEDGKRVSVVPEKPLLEDDWALIVKAHEAGVQGKVDAVDELLPLLQHERREVCLAALWSLARLGDQKALPAIDTLAADGSDPLRVAACARAVAARIQAAAGEPPANRAELAQRMRRLVRSADLTPAALEASVKRAHRTDPARVALAEAVLVQLSDMALVAADRGIPSPADASPVNLSLHPMARLKAELSAYPKAERIQRLVATLATAESGAGDVPRYIQLLIDEGPAALPVVLAQLEAQRRTDAPNSHVPYAALFRALQGLGGEDALAPVAAFRSHPDRWVRHYAEQTHWLLSRGMKRYGLLDYASAFTDHHGRS